MIVNRKNLIEDIYPKSWIEDIRNRSSQEFDVLQFRNLQHFKHYVKEMKPNKEGASHKRPTSFQDALSDLMKGVPVFDTSTYPNVYDEVRSVLHRKGLVSDEVYEDYEYDTEGEIIDIAKYIEGNPECMLRPKHAYTNYFYELYISMAHLAGVGDSEMMEGLARILATVQLLEKQHIYIKITVVTCSSDVVQGERTQLVLLPLYSHKDEKTIEEMSSVLNDRFFRIFTFGIKEDMYKEKLYKGYGVTIDLSDTIIPHHIDVVVLAQNILDKTIVPGSR